MLPIGTRVFVMPIKSYATIVGCPNDDYYPTDKGGWRRKSFLTKEDATKILDELTKPKIRVDTQYRHKFDPIFTATVKLVDEGNIFYTLNDGSPGALREEDFRRAYDVRY